MKLYVTGAIFLLVVVLSQAEDATSNEEPKRGRTSRILNSSPDSQRARGAKIIKEDATADVEGKSGRATRVIELDKTISDELRTLIKVSGRAASLMDILLWPFRRATPKPAQNRAKETNNATAINFDSAFDIIAAIDEARCIPRVICEINASQNDKSTQDEFEKIVIKMFEKPHTVKETPAGKLYREAAAMGKNLKSPLVCQNLYPKCKFPSQVLKNALLGEPTVKQLP